MTEITGHLRHLITRTHGLCTLAGHELAAMYIAGMPEHGHEAALERLTGRALELSEALMELVVEAERLRGLARQRDREELARMDAEYRRAEEDGKVTRIDDRRAA